MKSQLSLIVSLLMTASVLLVSCSAEGQDTDSAGLVNPENTASIHQFTVEDLSGQEFSMEQLKGKKVMVVNTASKCGLTPQYEGLQNLYETYKEKDFIIVGFPANNFLRQEPGSNEDIASFCQVNYGVTFPMMSKISVKGGDQHPVYEYLTRGELNGLSDSKVKWNFQKYLINENGYLEMIFNPKTDPEDPAIIEWITG